MSESLAPGLVMQNRFRVERAINVGGWGEVYRGTDLHSGRPVAIKRAVPVDPQDLQELGPDYALRRFQEEVAVLRRLDFPGIPKCLDSFTLAEDRYCLVMEFIEGVDLEQQLLDHLKLAGGLIPAAQTIEYLIQTCKIVEYLHAFQPDPVIHRDIKPSNLIVRHSDQRIYLVDFGFARSVGPSMGTKTMVGTIGYASIEQCQGNPGPLSDQYALGATLSYMLTGKPPIPFDIQPLDLSRPDLPTDLVRIVATATRNDKNDRFPSVQHLREELEAVLAQLTSPPEGEAQPATLPPLSLPPLPPLPNLELEEDPGNSEPLPILVEPEDDERPERDTEKWRLQTAIDPLRTSSSRLLPSPTVEVPQDRIIKKRLLQIEWRRRVAPLILLVCLVISLGIFWRSSQHVRQLRTASEVMLGWRPSAARGLEPAGAGSIVLTARNPEKDLFGSAELNGFLANLSSENQPPKKIELTLDAPEPAALWICLGVQGEDRWRLYRLLLLAPASATADNLLCNIYDGGEQKLNPATLLVPSVVGETLISSGDQTSLIYCNGPRIELRSAHLDRFGFLMQSSKAAVTLHLTLAQ